MCSYCVPTSYIFIIFSCVLTKSLRAQQTTYNFKSSVYLCVRCGLTKTPDIYSEGTFLSLKVKLFGHSRRA